MNPNKHAVLGASSMHRWAHCPGSVRMSRGVPKTTSVYAEEGSAAHYLAEVCLRKGQDAAEYQDRVIRRVKDGFSILKNTAEPTEGDFVATEDMVTAVQLYLDTVRTDVSAYPGAELRIEKKFKLNHLRDGLYGTNDACLGEPFGRLTVYDYKHGAGHPVDVESNHQLLYYALGASFGEDYEDIEICIVQPRARHKDGPVRRWVTSAEDLDKWAKEVLLPAAEATEDPNAPTVAGEWCKFCPAQPICPSMRNLAIEVAKSDFAEVPLPAADALSMLDLVKVLQSSELLKTWLRSVEGHAQNLLERGEEVPGYKLVRKKTNRVWTEEKALVTKLFAHREYLFEKKLLSPSKMEKFIKARGLEVDLSQYWEKPEGGLTIAPEADRREAVVINNNPALDFDDEMFA